MPPRLDATDTDATSSIVRTPESGRSGSNRADAFAHRRRERRRIAVGRHDERHAAGQVLRQRQVQLGVHRRLEAPVLDVGDDADDVDPVVGAAEPDALADRRRARPVAPRHRVVDDRDFRRGRRSPRP